MEHDNDITEYPTKIKENHQKLVKKHYSKSIKIIENQIRGHGTELVQNFDEDGKTQPS